jgi:hypothetical protein
MEKYVSIDVYNDTGEIDEIEGTDLKIFYTHDDLQMDNGSYLNESTLALYRYDEETWVRLSSDLDWVNSTGVNTTDQVLHGREYAGYLWAQTTHLSTFGIAGLPEGYVLPDDYFIRLTVLDEDGDPVDEAKVTLNINGTMYSGTTHEDGSVDIVLPFSARDVDVNVTIEAKGYVTATLDTRITRIGTLEDPLPGLIKEKEKGRDYTLIVLLAILLILIIIMVSVYLFKKKQEGDLEE